MTANQFQPLLNAQKFASMSAPGLSILAILPTAMIRRARRLVSGTTLTLAIFIVAPTAALAQIKAAYSGGTLALFEGAHEPVRGMLSTTDSGALVLSPTRKEWSSSVLRIPYSGIETIDYERREGGQGKIIAGALLAGPIGGALMGRGNVQYLVTLRYTDESGKSQVAILDVEPQKAFNLIAEIEQRSGKQRSARASTSASTEARAPRPNTPGVVDAAAPRQDAVNDAAPTTAPPTPAVNEKTAISNDDVVNMTRAGLGDDVVIMRIRSARPLFDTSANALVALKTAGVSDKVIATMIELKP